MNTPAGYAYKRATELIALLTEKQMDTLVERAEPPLMTLKANLPSDRWYKQREDIVWGAAMDLIKNEKAPTVYDAASSDQLVDDLVKAYKAAGHKRGGSYIEH